MKFVQLSDARANFAQLFDEVEAGETLVITRGEASSKPAEPSDAEARKKWLAAMRDLRDLKKGAGLATIDELLKWREEARQADRKRWKAPKLWTDMVRPRDLTNSRRLSGWGD
jgi:antitoxin (DNA-binding transcriptional repressor) of toxin-antitoxin stability system